MENNNIFEFPLFINNIKKYNKIWFFQKWRYCKIKKYITKYIHNSRYR